ncbi:hypothetical protein ACNSO7_02970, partial [Yersinia enterocolitica]
LQILVPPPPVAGQAPQSEANTIIAQKLDAAVKEFGRDVVKQCLSGGDCPMPVQIALLAIQAMMGQDDNGLSNTGGDQIAGAGAANTGGNQLPEPEQGINHTGNNTGQVDVGPNNTGGNQTVAQSPNNTGNTEGAPDLPTNYESSNKITQGEHAEIRNSEGRPVGAVINDVQKSRPADILLQDDGRWIVKGSGGNIHIIDPNGEVVTSFKNSDKNTAQRLNDGRWSRPDSSQLNEFKNKFSDYVRW